MGNTTQPVDSGDEWVDDDSSRGSPPSPHINGFRAAGSPLRTDRTAIGYSGNLNKVSPRPSPPTAYAKLARAPSGYQSLGSHLSSSPSGEKPISGQSQRSTAQSPLPPHYPQAHFFTAPQVDFSSLQDHPDSKGLVIRSCSVFDNLASAESEGFGGAENVLLVGLQNGLDVFSFDNGRVDRIGRLENLRGTVKGARLLPCWSRDDVASSLRPLVAVVVHGPQQIQHPMSSQEPKDQLDEALFDPSASTVEALERTENPDTSGNTLYQTTIEVYSLRESQHIATLLRSAPTDSHTDPQDISRSISAPVDDEMRLQVSGRFLIAGSSRSGEVFIFESRYDAENGFLPAFRCIGKTWTSVSQQTPRSRSASSSEAHKPVAEDSYGTAPHKREGVIFSLSHRWLAVVPPSKSNQTTVHASVDLPHPYHKPPGLGSHTSPPAPQVTCELDTPGQESIVNKVARDVTQEFMKGARWVGDQGIRAWKNYWQKPPDPGTVPRPLPGNTALPPMHNHLPPTHANDDHHSRPVNQRAIVSIIDLERLSANQSSKDEMALQPLAAFALPDGCSLVSFNPTGLGLLTASAKGDVQHVWSLMRMAHGALVSHEDMGPIHKMPSVQQIARFTRMTVARIVDVAWTEPGGERLAVVTERGTIHIYDLPPSALQWPQPRLIERFPVNTTQSVQASPELEAVKAANASSGRLGSTLDMIVGRTEPVLAAVRGRPASIGNPFSGFSGISLTAGAGLKSGKVVAAGFNRSVGAATGTVDTIRHLGENRLTLPGPLHAAAPGRVRWLGGRNRGHMAVTGGDTLRIHRINYSANVNPGKRRPSVIGSKPVELSLADTVGNIVRDQAWKAATGRGKADTSSGCSRGFWRAHAARPQLRVEEDRLHSQAEIDTNAPYQPFHTDRRVKLHVYSEDGIWSDPHRLENASPWAFGEAISTIRTSAGVAFSDEVDTTDVEEAGRMENHVSVQGKGKEGQQMVLTTRRRKAPRAGMAEVAADEVFEDDCEVVDFADERV